MNRQLTITTLDKGSFFIKMNAVLQKAKRDVVSVSLDVNGLPTVLTLIKDSQNEPYFFVRQQKSVALCVCPIWFVSP